MDITAKEARKLSSSFWAKEGLNVINEKIREAAQSGVSDVTITMDYDYGMYEHFVSLGFFVSYNGREMDISW